MATPTIPMMMYELRLSPERSTVEEESPETAPLTDWASVESELVEFELDAKNVWTLFALREEYSAIAALRSVT